MKTITLRSLPPEVAHRVEEKSRELGLSLNKTVLRLLEERLLGDRKARPPRRHSDLDEVAGALAAESADELDRAIEEQRRVDEDLWR